jgi:hypothetical protein
LFITLLTSLKNNKNNYIKKVIKKVFIYKKVLAKLRGQRGRENILYNKTKKQPNVEIVYGFIAG